MSVSILEVLCGIFVIYWFYGMLFVGFYFVVFLEGLNYMVNDFRFELGFVVEFVFWCVVLVCCLLVVLMFVCLEFKIFLLRVNGFLVLFYGWGFVVLNVEFLIGWVFFYLCFWCYYVYDVVWSMCKKFGVVIEMMFFVF